MTAPIIPLLEAYASPDPLPIIRDWSAAIDFDRDANINHIYLLGRLSPRLADRPDTSMPLLPRIKGFARWLWAKQQLALQEWNTLQTHLAAHDVLAILPGLLAPRQLRLSWECGPQNIYIRESDLDRALTILREVGWRIRRYYTPPSRYPLIGGLQLWHHDQGYLELRWRLFDHYWGEPQEIAVWDRQQDSILHSHDQVLWLVRQAASYPKVWHFFMADILFFNLSENDWSEIMELAHQHHLTGHLASFMRIASTNVPDLIPAASLILEPVPLERYRPRTFLWLVHQLSNIHKQAGLSQALTMLDRWVSFKTLPGRWRHRLIEKLSDE